MNEFGQQSHKRVSSSINPHQASSTPESTSQSMPLTHLEGENLKVASEDGTASPENKDKSRPQDSQRELALVDRALQTPLATYDSILPILAAQDPEMALKTLFVKSEADRIMQVTKQKFALRLAGLYFGAVSSFSALAGGAIVACLHESFPVAVFLLGAGTASAGAVYALATEQVVTLTDFTDSVVRMIERKGSSSKNISPSGLGSDKTENSDIPKTSEHIEGVNMSSSKSSSMMFGSKSSSTMSGSKGQGDF